MIGIENLHIVVNINIGFGIPIILNLLLFTLITIWISCYLDPDEIGRTFFQSPYFKGLFHNSQLCKYVLFNVAIQHYAKIFVRVLTRALYWGNFFDTIA